MLAELDGEPLVIVRGRDDVVRAFFNVCRHRGTAVVEEQCGTAVRFQCPYHAWIYDLDGRLVRAKHTDDLADFKFEDFGLRPVRLDAWQGFLFASLAEEGPSPTGSSWPRTTASAITARGSIRS
jgi:choline monooxygenase